MTSTTSVRSQPPASGGSGVGGYLQQSGNFCKERVLTPTFVLVCGLTCSSALILEGFLCFTLCAVNFRSYVLSFYYICFGLMTISAELQIRRLLENFKVLESYFGKGLWYLFLGFAALGGEWWALTISSFVILAGLLNLCVSPFLPPRCASPRQLRVDSSLADDSSVDPSLQRSEMTVSKEISKQSLIQAANGNANADDVAIAIGEAAVLDVNTNPFVAEGAFES